MIHLQNVHVASDNPLQVRTVFDLDGCHYVVANERNLIGILNEIIVNSQGLCQDPLDLIKKPDICFLILEAGAEFKGVLPSLELLQLQGDF